MALIATALFVFSCNKSEIKAPVQEDIQINNFELTRWKLEWEWPIKFKLVSGYPSNSTCYESNITFCEIVINPPKKDVAYPKDYTGTNLAVYGNEFLLELTPDMMPYVLNGYITIHNIFLPNEAFTECFLTPYIPQGGMHQVRQIEGKSYIKLKR